MMILAPLTCNSNPNRTANKMQWMPGILTAHLNIHTAIRIGEVAVIKFDPRAKTEPLIQQKQRGNVLIEIGKNRILLRVINIAFVRKMPAIIRTTMLLSTGQYW